MTDTLSPVPSSAGQLVELLEGRAQAIEPGTCRFYIEPDDTELDRQAATLLTAQASEIERLRGERGPPHPVDGPYAEEFSKRMAAESRAEHAEAERDEARGWIRWLVRQTKDDQMSLKERVGVVAHFPADEYPPHPAEATVASQAVRITELEEHAARVQLDLGLLIAQARDFISLAKALQEEDEARTTLAAQQDQKGEVE